MYKTNYHTVTIACEDCRVNTVTMDRMPYGPVYCERCEKERNEAHSRMADAILLQQQRRRKAA